MNPPSFTGLSTTEDPKSFVEELQKNGLGSKVNLSIAFHSQTYCQPERTIQTLEDMLRACVRVTRMITYLALSFLITIVTTLASRCLRMMLFMGEDADLQLDGLRRRELEFEVDNWVYLKVSTMKGVMRLVRRGNLVPQYIGPYRISKRVGNVSYELERSQELAAVHPTFHISMLKKCMRDPSHIIPNGDIGIKDSLSYEEIPVQILDRQVRKLRTKEVASVKVLWRNEFVEEATWEAEKDMKKRYPHLFEPGEIPDQGTNSLLSTF
ncbi:hypothetical protein MTR67_038759 [Solanum verrucosum]|uniref:Tf2-1-like SH3-like domain-containing protein n=1 Tax=Solanum verrucosum TaxID=315347 RepID=A0AAF0UHE3_SOLVR|nr:hypothetical protein MTR67_038759 [Solanum verrucosum]